MFRGQEHGQDITIGLSSASKVWTNAYPQIPHLLKWCGHIAKKLTSTTGKKAQTNWELLPMASRVTSLPAGRAVAADWPPEFYDAPPFLRYFVAGEGHEVGLLDCDLTVDTAVSGDVIAFRLTCNDATWPFSFALLPSPTVSAGNWDDQDSPVVVLEGDEVFLTDFLGAYLPTFYFADFSTLTGDQYVAAVTAGLFFAPEQIEPVDWAAEGVDMESERHNPKGGRISIHEYLCQRLMNEQHDAVVYDDGSGEIADFVAIDEDDDFVRIVLFHAKASTSLKAGERVEDVYEVTGQVVKSTRWTHPPAKLFDRLLERCRDRTEKLVVGTREDLKRLRTAAEAKRVSFRICVVQPGISRAKLTQESIALPLASADNFVRDAAFEALAVIASA